jgi:amphi-Trp domain-containing protein
MAKKRWLFRSKERRDADAVAAFLRDLAAGVESGEITFQQAGQQVPIAVPGALDLKVAAGEKDKKRGTRTTLKLVLKWSEGDVDEGTLKIV